MQHLYHEMRLIKIDFGELKRSGGREIIIKKISSCFSNG